MNMKLEIIEDQKENFQICFRYLLSGKTIYYSDNISSRLGSYLANINSNKIHEFGKNLYRFMYENYETFKILMEVIGYTLVRGEHRALSSLPENRYYYFAQPIKLQYSINTERSRNLERADVIIISALILETNRGTQFIDYKEDFLDKIVREPQNVLKMEISFIKFAKIISPKSRNITESQDTINKIREKVDERVKRKLVPLNYLQIVQNNQKKLIISLGPSSFRFISLFRSFKKKKVERNGL